MIQLTDIEARILGCLSEKEETTPDNYPLTLNSLTSACNQKSNRNPVVEYEEEEVAQAMDTLREKKMAFRVDVAGSRVAKFKHRIDEHFFLNRSEKVLLTLLLLRGAQTPGELKTRGDRMFVFKDVAEVEQSIASANENNDEQLFEILPPQPGQKEKRYFQLLSETLVENNDQSISEQPIATRNSVQVELENRVTELEEELSVLKEEFAEFRKQFE